VPDIQGLRSAPHLRKFLAMFDLKTDLNTEQFRAASHVKGPLLVIAGAGSGKTRVITYRIANLVANHRVAPWRILAVTFTNKAAREMRERVTQLISGDGMNCWVSTFHATCARLLRSYGDLIGVDPKFTIYDDSDQKAMVARCIRDMGCNDKQFPPRSIQNEINRSKQEGLGPDLYGAGDYYREQIKSIFTLYEKRMRESSALDFGDLLFRTVNGLKKSTQFRETLRNKFDYILVDEFQDTNNAQLEIVKQLSTGHRNICVVGDDDQSIYSWRGAEIKNILEFDKVFPGTTVVTLDRNYRSSGNILAASHSVAAKLLKRHPKELWTDDTQGDKIALVEAEDEREEARLVARAVKELHNDGYSLNQQAVFYRINAQSRVFEEVFRTMRIPYRVVGGTRFYERAEVKDILAYLRLIQNPGDAAAFLRVVNVPTRGIGKTTIERLTAHATRKEVPYFEAVKEAEQAGISDAAKKKLTAFLEMIAGWRSERDHGPHHLAERVLEDTGYLTNLRRQNSAEADARLENIKELLGSILDFEQEAETPTLDAFLELVALQSDVDSADFAGEEVTLMTVHSSKGLEFNVVYVTGLEQGMFPYIKRSDGFMDTPSIDENEEERRLCYVAMTRARKRLFLSLARTRTIFGQAHQNRQSQFLRDISPDLIMDITPNRPCISAVSTPGRTGFSAGSRQRGLSFQRAPLPTRPPVGNPPNRIDRLALNQPNHNIADSTWVDRSFDQRPAEEALRPGAEVRHARYGIGEVISVQPGPRPKVTVSFPGFGRKTIIADYLEVG
jgi:DNA helicase II / ATP-dependent DNA helicase PcrA